jgi:hypothetical protein
MSAGTQGFIDTRQDTNHIGKVISTILEARKLAEDERKYAETVADKYQTSLEEAGIKRGHFFKKALRWKFGGEFKQKKLAQLNTWKTKGGLLKSALSGKSGQNKLDKFERTQALFDMFKASDKPKTFRDKFKPLYEGFVDDPMTRPRSHWVKPGTAKKFQKATGKKKRVSKEDILDSLGAITESIQKVAESISEKNKVVADQMIHSSVLQGMLHQELKASGNSLDDKLQKIIDAISNQTEFQKQTTERAKSKDAENRLERQKDAAGIVNFDDLTTKEDESKVAATSSQDIEHQQMSAYEQNDIPKAEQGGIFSGPDSGYLAELHGNEMVVPLDNNFTQGEPSAVDGKVRPKPQQPIATPKSIGSMPKYEMGTSNISNTFNNLPTYEKGSDTTVNTAPITSKFGFNTTKNIIGTAGGGTSESTKLTQSMVDVMSLPMMAAGGTILSATTKYMQSLGGEGANINPEIERVARPIASVFGLPPAIVSIAKKSKQTEDEKTGDKKSKPDLFSKLLDGFGKMLEKLGESINNNSPGTTGSGTGSDSAGENLAAFISTLEATGEQNQADVLQVMVNRAKGDSDKLFDEVTGRAQFTPASSAIYGATGHDPAADAAYGHIAPLLGNTPEERKAKLREIAAGPDGINNLRELFKTGNAAAAAKILNDFKTGGPLSAKSRADVGGGLYFKGRSQNPGGVYLDRGDPGANKFHSERDGGGGKEGTAYQMAQSAPTPQATPAVQTPAPSTANPTPQPPNTPLTGKVIRSFKVGNFTYTQREGDVYTKNGVRISKENFDAIVRNHPSVSISPPPSTRQQTQQQVSSLSLSGPPKSSGGGITVLNTGGGQQIASAGSSPQPSGDVGVGPGRNPVPSGSFFPSSANIGIS